MKQVDPLVAVDRMGFWGIEGPKGMRKDLVETISDAARRALGDPLTRRRMEDTRSIVIAVTPDDFEARIRSEYELYWHMVAKQKLTVE